MTQEDIKEIAGVIADYGNTITLSRNVTIKAIVETSYDAISRNFAPGELEKAQGRLVLFYMSPADAAKIPNGTLLPYDGESFTLSEVKTAAFSNSDLMVTILGASGGYA